MAETITVESLKDELEIVSYNFAEADTDKILARVNHLLKMYAMKSETLINELMAFMMNKKVSSVTMDLLESFDEDCLAKKLLSKPKSTPGARSRFHASILETVGKTVAPAEMLGLYGNSDAPYDESLLATPSSSMPVKLENRQVLSNYSHHGKFYNPSESKRTTAIQFELVNRKTINSSYGNEKIVDVIQTDIEHIGYFPHNEDEIVDDCIVGYVFKEAGGIDMISDKNACIRTYNSIKKLDLRNAEEVTLFPGQRVKLLGGENTIGDTFHVTSFAPRSILPLANLRIPEKASNLSCMIAAGPYTSTTKHDFTDLYQLIDEAVASADLLILSGPFLSRSSSFYTSADCAATVQEYFEHFLLEVNARVKSSHLHVVIVPNGQKDFTALPFYPTPAFTIDQRLDRRLSANIHLCPDPAVISIDGVRLAIGNSDVIAKLSKCEFHRSANSENTDRMRRLYGHLLQAHSLYPLYQCEQDNLPVNTKSQQGFEITEAPHVLIAPSVLGQHTKIVYGSLCVNPGPYWRGSQRNHVKIFVDLAGLVKQGRTEKVTIAQHTKVDIVRDTTK